MPPQAPQPTPTRDSSNPVEPDALSDFPCFHSKSKFTLDSHVNKIMAIAPDKENRTGRFAIESSNTFAAGRIDFDTSNSPWSTFQLCAVTMRVTKVAADITVAIHHQ